MGETNLKQVWEQMEYLVKSKLVKSIGIAHFCIQDIDNLLKYAKIKPVTIQVEFHPYFNQQHLREYCKLHHIVLSSVAPMGKINLEKFDSPLYDPVILNIADVLNKTPAQIIIRWLLQLGLVVVKQSVDPIIINKNSQVNDFDLTAEMIGLIDRLGERNIRQWNPKFGPNGSFIFEG